MHRLGSPVVLRVGDCARLQNRRRVLGQRILHAGPWQSPGRENQQVGPQMLCSRGLMSRGRHAVDVVSVGASGLLGGAGGLGRRCSWVDASSSPTSCPRTNIALTDDRPDNGQPQRVALDLHSTNVPRTNPTSRAPHGPGCSPEWPEGVDPGLVPVEDEAPPGPPPHRVSDGRLRMSRHWWPSRYSVAKGEGAYEGRRSWRDARGRWCFRTSRGDGTSEMLVSPRCACRHQSTPSHGPTCHATPRTNR